MSASTDNSPLLPVAGRVVMISGASRGIGKAIAAWLHKEGFSISLGVRTPASTKWIEQSDRVLISKYDATDKKSAKAWVEATYQKFGRIDAW